MSSNSNKRKNPADTNLAASVPSPTALSSKRLRNSLRLVEIDSCTIRDAVKVYVGDDPKAFYIHTGLVTASSDFFNKSLKSGFTESEGKIHLKTQDPAHFSIYIQWLYTEELKSPADSSVFWKTQIALVVLADFLQDRGFGNAVIDAAIKHFRRKGTIPKDCAKLAWEVLPAKSKMRQLLVDLLAHADSSDLYSMPQLCDDMLNAPQDFWLNVSKSKTAYIERLRNDKRTPSPWLENPSQYHDHLEGDKSNGGVLSPFEPF